MSFFPLINKPHSIWIFCKKPPWFEALFIGRSTCQSHITKGLYYSHPLMRESSLPWGKFWLEEGFLLKCSHCVHKKTLSVKGGEYCGEKVISSQRDRYEFQVQLKYVRAGNHMLLAGSWEKDVIWRHCVPGQFYWQIFEIIYYSKMGQLTIARA